MSIDQAAAPTRRPAAAGLLRDATVQTAAGIIVAGVGLYALKLVDPATLSGAAVPLIELPMVAIAVAAAFLGVKRAGGSAEVGFWQTLGVGSLGWLAKILLEWAFSRGAGGPATDVALAAAHVWFAVPFLLAAERTPHLPRVAGHAATARRLSWAGLILVGLCWFAYFVAVPLAADPERPGPLGTTGPLFIILDLLIVARFLSAAATCRSPRWTMLYASIAVSAGVVLATDVLQALIARRLIAWPAGSVADVVWGVAPLCLLVAFRLRHLEWPPDGTPALVDWHREVEPARVAFALLAQAACFPLVAVALHAVDVLPPAAQSAEDVVAMASLVIVGGVGVLSYRILERHRAADARARASLEVRLQDARKMEALGRLSSVVTHEFLNLLNAIGGYIDLTLDELPTDDPHIDNLRRAHDVVRRTTGFTQRLLVLGRGAPFRPAVIGFDRAVQDLMGEIRTLVRPPAAVDAALGAGGGSVAISAEYFREVLMPLAANAGEAMAEHGGRLTIETGMAELGPQEAIALALRPGRYGRLVVRDTGCGIPKEVLSHLFEPFFTTKAKPRTRGLGLATAYVVVTQHGGSITVTSEPGEGTTVEVLLPERTGE